MTTRIDCFKNEYHWLSNFYVLPKPIEFEGLLYTTTEHAFQAAKTLDQEKRIKIRDARTPNRAKRMGRALKPLRPGWDDMRVMVMHSICWLKFEHPILRRWLLETGDAELIEGNDWRDTFWGTVNGKGENQLGKALMSIRDVIRRSQADV